MELGIFKIKVLGFYTLKLHPGYEMHCSKGLQIGLDYPGTRTVCQIADTSVFLVSASIGKTSCYAAKAEIKPTYLGLALTFAVELSGLLCS